MDDVVTYDDVNDDVNGGVNDDVNDDLNDLSFRLLCLTYNNLFHGLISVPAETHGASAHSDFNLQY